MSLPERVERVCVELRRGHLRDLADEAGASALLERILAEIRADIPSPDVLSADLDAFDEALAVLGVDGVTGADRSYQELRGAIGRRPEYVWVCPERRCSLGLPAGPGEAAPACAVSGAPLERTRLRR